MGMRIGGGSYSAADQMQWQQRKQSVDALAQAISGGSLSTAQDAFLKISSQFASSGKKIDPNSFLGKIGAALQSNDISKAQQLLASRQNSQRNQAASNGSTASDATMAAAVSTTSGAIQGRYHHSHGGGGDSPALDLSQAIQSGDTSTAQSSMQKIIADLQQLSSLSNPTGSATAGYNSGVSSASSAANALLQNPDFQSLQAAVSKGDTAGMKTAWANLINGSSSASKASSSSVQPQVAA